MTTTLRVKIGGIEVEYQSDSPLTKDDVLEIVDRVSLLRDLPESQEETGEISASNGGDNDERLFNLSTSSIAAKLNASSGPDLLLAACLYLEVSEGKTSYERRQILTAMKGATGYYRDTYSKNLSKYMTGLIKDNKLSQLASGKYCLMAKTKGELKTKLDS